MKRQLATFPIAEYVRLVNDRSLKFE